MAAPLEQLADDPKRAAIASAAIDVFSERGFSRTSMAHIADQAGMSRPALYQYFENKGDIFGFAFTALVEGAAHRALAALDEPGTVADQLEGSGLRRRFLGEPRFPYGDELPSAKSEYAPEAIGMRDGASAACWSATCEASTPAKDRRSPERGARAGSICSSSRPVGSSSQAAALRLPKPADGSREEHRGGHRDESESGH